MVQLGWIDFSKNDRNRILDILNLLGEKGTLDELGIAPIRDAYSNLFFPGITTIQTRAKYFLIVPYALNDLKFNNQFDYVKLKDTFDKIEKDCANVFLEKYPDEYGIIGKTAVSNNSWVKRTPSNIYWNGIQRFGILKVKCSADECIRLIHIGKQNTNTDEEAFKQYLHLFNIPTYHKDWFSNLNINLTPDEAIFLKNQIISSCPDSMLSFILKENLYDVLDCNSFDDLNCIIDRFPLSIQKDFYDAISFSEFNHALLVIYNVIVSDNNNENAVMSLGDIDFNKVSEIDINHIMHSLNIFNPVLSNFLNKSKRLMKTEDIDALKSLVRDREIYLKGTNRSKSCHPGEFDDNMWFGGKHLNYRFSNARNIIQDIYDGEK